MADRAAPLPPDIAFLARHGFPERLLAMAVRLAALRGTSARDELFALDAFDRRLYWRLLAEELGVAFVDGADGYSLDGQAGFVPSESVRRASRAYARDADGASRLLLAPEEKDLTALGSLLRHSPSARELIRVAPPETIRALILEGRASGFVHLAVHRLAKAWPDLSARSTSSLSLRWMLGLALALCLTASFLAPVTTWTALGTLLTMLFFNGVVWKLAAALHRGQPAPLPRLREDALPSYSVLVPLHREAAIVPDLVAAMAALDYPAPKLDVLLVAEADDEETLGALRRHALPPRIQIVVVPPAEPRTKPKALVYALPFARGDLVVVYDAEDRPEPDQLRKAAALFAARPLLGCVQARLTPDNAETWFARMFTIEYAMNFDVLLPALADWDAPLPLGGTSNHFPRAVLEEVGAWDPFNVTEDADLGIRLAAFGWRTGTLVSRTFEEAPVFWSQWLPQRRRWLKGWMQTIAVCMTSSGPRLTLFERLAVHAILTAGLVSLLVYPFSLVVIVLSVFLLEQGLWPTTPLGVVLFGLNGFNLVAFALASAIAGLRGLDAIGALRLAPWLAYLPFYWMLMSLAAWQALGQFLRSPTTWEKTTHGIALGRRTPMPSVRPSQEPGGVERVIAETHPVADAGGQGRNNR